ncbi:MAG: aryl-sulfate sulfotransferase, partial [Myxococcota bacterium]
PAVLENPGYHHEALVTSEGWLVSLQGVENSHGGEPFIGFRIEAHDPSTGELTWSLDSQPLVDAGVLPAPPAGDADPYHANAISWVDDDPLGASVWVSLRGTGNLMRVDRATSTVTGFFGPEEGLDLVDPSGGPLPPTDWFWGQHAPEIVGNRFLVYDNGGRRPGAGLYSRVAEYVRTSATEVQLAWDWTEPGWYEPNFGSAVTMPNGHVLVATGHCGDCEPKGDAAWILELDPGAGTVVWRFDLTGDDSVYRGQPIDGCGIFANVRWCPALGE